MTILAKLLFGLAVVGLPGKRYPSRLARQRGIAVVELSCPDDGLRRAVAQMAPEFIVSVANPRLFGDDVLALAKIGGLNSHSSLLPWYRGVLTGFWALLDGATESGVSIHAISNDVDAGRIVTQTTFAISPDETMFSYYRKASTAGGQLWADILAKIDRDGLDAMAMDLPLEDRNDVYGRPSMDKFSAFSKQGKRFI